MIHRSTGSSGPSGAIAASAVSEAIGIGAALGAIGGSLNEVLTRHGVDEADATYYNDRMKDGAVLVTVEDDFADSAQVAEVLRSNGGHNAASPRMI